MPDLSDRAASLVLVRPIEADRETIRASGTRDRGEAPRRGARRIVSVPGEAIPSDRVEVAAACRLFLRRTDGQALVRAETKSAEIEMYGLMLETAGGLRMAEAGRRYRDGKYPAVGYSGTTSYDHEDQSARGSRPKG